MKSSETVRRKFAESLLFTRKVVKPYVDVSRIAKLSFEEKKRLSNESLDKYMEAAKEKTE